jgi:hypothetical protein
MRTGQSEMLEKRRRRRRRESVCVFKKFIDNQQVTGRRRVCW